MADSGSDACLAQPRLFDIYTSANLHVSARVYDPAGPVCVSFASGGRPRELAGDGTAEKYGLNWISVATKEMDWFQYPDMPDAEAAIREATRGFSRVLAYGFSMGAYGALMSSDAIGADVVLALSPQAAMGPACPPRESRWGDERARIAHEFGFPHDDIARRLSRTAEIILVYDRLDHDIDHVRMVEAVRPITPIHFPLAGHNTLPLLAVLGMASDMVRQALEGSFDAAAFQAELHRLRRGELRLDGLTAALELRNRAIPDPLMRRLALEVTAVPRSRLRKFAQRSLKGDHADTLLIFVRRLLADTGYLAEPGFVAEITSFAPLLATAPQVDELLAEIDERAAGAVDKRKVVPLMVAAARIHQARGNMGEALRCAERAAGKVTAWDERENALLQGIFAELGEPGRAAQFGRRVDARRSPDFKAFEADAKALERENDWAGAAAVWRQALDGGVAATRVALPLGRALSRLSDHEGALEALAPALALDSPSPEVLKLAGSSVAKLRRHDEALGFFRRAVASAPSDHGAHRLLSNGLLSMGDVEGALGSMRTSLSLRPMEASAAQVARLEAMLAKRA